MLLFIIVVAVLLVVVVIVLLVYCIFVFTDDPIHLPLKLSLYWVSDRWNFAAVFTATARWAEVVIMSKSDVYMCVYVLDTFLQSQYKQSRRQGWFPGWPGGLGLLSAGLRRSLGWSPTPGWSASLRQSPFVVKIC